MYGGMDLDEREDVKAAFQSAPEVSRVRILLATDAAAEGLNLQNHCYRLIHYEIPWNPNRLEQRNGRIDRHGQKGFLAPNGERRVLVYHFVGQGYKEREQSTFAGRASELDADLAFLMRVAQKVETIREDLGSYGTVLADDVEQAMLGRGYSMPGVNRADTKAEPVRKMLKFERDLKKQIGELLEQYRETQRELRLSPDNIRKVVEVGLELAVGPAEGMPKELWKLRSAKELLELKICDMACGSGAFLVQVCRYTAARLLEAWDAVQRANSDLVRITPEGEPSTGHVGETLIPHNPDERQTYALRIVAQRCVYGVDKNPLAVEMAKLSLWLLTLAKDKPFEFLDHAIRCGDSLIGIHDLEQLRTFNLDLKGDENQLFLQFMESRIRGVVELRTRIEATESNRAEDVELQDRLLREATEKIERVKYSADMLVGAEFLRWDQGDLIHDELDSKKAGVDEHRRPTPEWLRAKRATEEFRRAARTSATITVATMFNHADVNAFKEQSRLRLNGQAPFHWPLEFAEVMAERGGFDAFVCNPPFMGGQKITGNLGEDYREYLVKLLGRGQRGSADLCAYFFLRAASSLRHCGQLGFLATNTIAQGDTREVGLDQLAARGFSIPRAVASRPWPGQASLEVAHVWIRRGGWPAPFVLDDKPIAGIRSFLTEPGAVTGKPFRLKANEGKSFIGSYVLGMGFVLSADEANNLIDKDPKNKDVLYTYLNGEDLNTRPDQSPSRWVINFFDWPLDRDSAPKSYDGPVAADYPDCLAIVVEKVKPERTPKQKNPTDRDRANRHLRPTSMRW
jgi:Helicase conserved C-terminal domain